MSLFTKLSASIIFFTFFQFKIRGDSIGFHKLLYRLVAQRPVTFFQDHIAWSKNHDEKFAPKNGIISKNGSKPFKLPKISKDEGMKEK